jgi:glycosyltransferase involved in cell wall biosynthesis
MRILYSYRIQSRDGMSVHIEELVAALRAARHEVLVIGPSFHSQSSFGWKSRTVALIRRVLPPALSELAELAYNVPAYCRLRRACSSFRPDLIYERNNLYFLAGSILARRKGWPFYLEVNSPIAAERGRECGLRLRWLARLLEHYVWKSADRVLVVTDVLKHVLAVEAGVQPQRITVIPNGAHPERYHVQPRPNDSGKPVILGFVGFVRTWHGLDAAIRAIAIDTELARTILFVLGDGPARSGLEALTAQLGIRERVRFFGNVEHTQVRELLAKIDIALQPRANSYASPLKIFDYMAAGCAIVAPDQPNIREVLEHDRTALLFDPTHPDALRQAILRLATDTALRQRLGAAARAELIRKDYTWTANARRITTLAQTDIAAVCWRERVRSLRLTVPPSTRLGWLSNLARLFQTQASGQIGQRQGGHRTRDGSASM